MNKTIQRNIKIVSLILSAIFLIVGLILTGETEVKKIVLSHNMLLLRYLVIRVGFALMIIGGALEALKETK